MGTTLFLIDPQNDFVDEPGAALPVPGSSIDLINLSYLLRDHGDQINRVVVTLDQHPFNHIAHATMWVDAEGFHPPLFTAIRYDDIKNNQWRSANPDLQMIMAAYVNEVEDLGETLTIWPPHCLLGTRGANIHDRLLAGLYRWWRSDRELIIFPKSANWSTEQYSSFKAIVVRPDDPSTDFNYRLLDAIDSDQVLVAGEALSHCVAATVMDAIKEVDHFAIASHMVLLSDCSNPVFGFEKQADAFMASFQELGGRVAKSTEIFM